MLSLTSQAITVVQHYNFCDISPAMRSSGFTWNKTSTLAWCDPCIITHRPWTACHCDGFAIPRCYLVISTVWAPTHQQSQDLIVWEGSDAEGLMVIPIFTPLKAWLRLTFGFIVFSMCEEERPDAAGEKSLSLSSKACCKVQWWYWASSHHLQEAFAFIHLSICS